MPSESKESSNKNESPEPASFTAQYTCLGVLIGMFALWAKYAFVPEETSTPGVHVPMHDYHATLYLTAGYLISLPIIKYFVDTYTKNVDMKSLLFPSMVLYNVAQVAINGWMVYRFVKAVVSEGHPFIGSVSATGTSYVVWVHYCDKYLEFLDTYFMVLRGKMNQVSFLHIYHHTSIAWAWWIGYTIMPGGDSYFGALLNSWIHVMMYSYYVLALFKISCPWKKLLTQAQLLQFLSVIVYSFFSLNSWSKEERTNSHLLASGIQVWEMSSLFFLFVVFYRKSYSSKKRKLDNDVQPFSTKTTSATNTNNIVATAQKVATASLDAATEDVSKIVSTAQRDPRVKNVVGATNIPSWSLVS
eukprot:CAMPEP_0195526930 /NCGR_PEP_ID=MMETSP0794_2-20130614/28266_1 /TAXON_ID=515487 /ORGANISM="Stephanopyxis turris, Strain CCMP 815" /LENGTH=357 /DNA_ID=CAMNT_0040657721 /DNA_START=140 /DNA_END=1213 /DNA_ORIENTATION=+